MISGQRRGRLEQRELNMLARSHWLVRTSTFVGIRFIVAVGLAAFLPALAGAQQQQVKKASAAADETVTVASPDEAFNGNAAFEMLRTIVDLGPRISGTEAMRNQQQILEERFKALGAVVWYNEFPVAHPESGRAVKIRNMIVTWHPDRRDRIMICTHYDTRPFPDRDPKKPRGRFDGANDGGSGVGLLAELGRHMPNIDAKFGVDFVFFDAEEFVFVAGRDPLFVGSTGFANAYITKPEQRQFNYVTGVLVDMIGDKHLDLYWEENSVRAAENVVREIWSVAADLGIAEFNPKIRHTVNDDHIPLIKIAKIPTIDIIDFDFPTIESKHAYWHTQKDTIEACSAESLQKVGSVLLEWLRRRATQ